jgi:FKBP-type peptidyl-prolyl cis-trans isomerase SlyD
MTSFQSAPLSDQVVKPGKYVSLVYSIADEAGNILEQTDLPVGYIHGGRSELIGGMDKAVAGKRAGDRVELTLAPDEGFGSHDPDLTFTDDLENVPPEFRFVGAEVQMQNDAGEVRTFYVTHLDEDKLTVDGNHPFAGKSLKVFVRIQEVRDPTPEELSRDLAATIQPGGTLH